jgi:low molecular weight protein-tyrosine phosphatase
LKRSAATSVLFVCLGNICRSPTAEGVFRTVAARAGLAAHVRADSAGLGDWHAGSAPDLRAIHAASRRGYDLSALRARQIEPVDFTRFDWILAMDHANLRALNAMKPRDFRGHLGLFLDLVPDGGLREVPDPFFGGPQGFETVLDLVEKASTALVDRVREGWRDERSEASRDQ